MIFRPYFGLLLVIDAATFLESLPADSSSTLSKLVKHLNSSYSMSRLSFEVDIPLSQVSYFVVLIGIAFFLILRFIVLQVIYFIGVEQKLSTQFMMIIFTLFHPMPIFPSINNYFLSNNSNIEFCFFFFAFIRQGSLSKMYKDKFTNTLSYPTLQEALAEYSDALSFYDHISRYDNQTESVSFQ